MTVSAAEFDDFSATDLAFAAILMLSLLGILLFTLVALAEKVLCPWYDKA